MKYRFIDAHRDTHAVRRLCKRLGVSASGYYDWRQRPLSARAKRHQRLGEMLQRFFALSRDTYGSRRLADDLRAAGDVVGRHTVRRLMRALGLEPKTVKRCRASRQVRHTNAASNLLAKQFQAERANQRWVSDITFIATRQGWLYLAIVIDLFSRAVVGWSMSTRPKQTLVIDALQMAIDQRIPTELKLVHSDQGTQYSAAQYQRLVRAQGAQCSMSRKGCCGDNAVAESFFHTLKTELVHHEDYRTRVEARSSIFHYIEAFYNRRRRHSFNGNLSPMNYENNVQQSSNTLSILLGPVPIISGVALFSWKLGRLRQWFYPLQGSKIFLNCI